MPLTTDDLLRFLAYARGDHGPRLAATAPGATRGNPIALPGLTATVARGPFSRMANAYRLNDQLAAMPRPAPAPPEDGRGAARMFPGLGSLGEIVDEPHPALPVPVRPVDWSTGRRPSGMDRRIGTTDTQAKIGPLQSHEPLLALPAMEWEGQEQGARGLQSMAVEAPLEGLANLAEEAALHGVAPYMAGPAQRLRGAVRRGAEGRERRASEGLPSTGYGMANRLAGGLAGLGALNAALPVGGAAAIDAALGASSREGSMSGMAAEATGNATLENLTRSPGTRAAMDAVGGGVLSSLLHAAGGAEHAAPRPHPAELTGVAPLDALGNSAPMRAAADRLMAPALRGAVADGVRSMRRLGAEPAQPLPNVQGQMPAGAPRVAMGGASIVSRLPEIAPADRDGHVLDNLRRGAELAPEPAPEPRMGPAPVLTPQSFVRRSMDEVPQPVPVSGPGESPPPLASLSSVHAALLHTPITDPAAAPLARLNVAMQQGASFEDAFTRLSTAAKALVRPLIEVRGEAPAPVARALAGAGAGALGGAALDPGNRTRGAMEGGLAGAAVGLAPELLESARRHAGNQAGMYNPRGKGVERFTEGELRQMARAMDGHPSQAAVLAELAAREAETQKHMAAAQDVLQQEEAYAPRPDLLGVDPADQHMIRVGRSAHRDNLAALHEDMSQRVPGSADHPVTGPRYQVPSLRLPTPEEMEHALQTGTLASDAARGHLAGEMQQVADHARRQGALDVAHVYDALGAFYRGEIPREAAADAYSAAPAQRGGVPSYDFVSAAPRPYPAAEVFGPASLRAAAGAGLGAGYGAATDEEDPVRGGARGALAGGALGLAPEVLSSVAHHVGNEVGAFNPAGRGLERFTDAELANFARRTQGSSAHDAVAAEISARAQALSAHATAADSALQEAGDSDYRNAFIGHPADVKQSVQLFRATHGGNRIGDVAAMQVPDPAQAAASQSIAARAPSAARHMMIEEAEKLAAKARGGNRDDVAGWYTTFARNLGAMGAAHPDVLTLATGVGVGASLGAAGGAAMAPDHPLRGAAAGAVLGAAVGGVLTHMVMPRGQPLPIPPEFARDYRARESMIDWTGRLEKDAVRASRGNARQRFDAATDWLANGTGPVERVGRSVDEVVPYEHNAWDRLTQWKNRDHQVERALLGDGIPDPLDPRRTLAPPARDIVAHFGGNPRAIRQFFTYVVNKRLVGRGLQGFGGDVAQYEQAQRVVSLFDNVPEMVEAARRLKTYTDALGEYAVRTGLFTPEQWERIRESDALYIPTRRVMGGVTAALPPRGGGIGKKLLGITSGVPEFFGSARAVMEPGEALTDWTKGIIHRALAHRVGDAVIDNLQKIPGWEQILTPINPRPVVEAVDGLRTTSRPQYRFAPLRRTAAPEGFEPTSQGSLQGPARSRVRGLEPTTLRSSRSSAVAQLDGLETFGRDAVDDPAASVEGLETDAGSATGGASAESLDGLEGNTPSAPRIPGRGAPARVRRAAATGRAEAQEPLISDEARAALSELAPYVHDKLNPIVWRNGPSGREEFQLHAPALYNALGMLRDTGDGALRQIADAVFLPLRRVFTDTTTGLSLPFALVGNPARDFVDTVGKSRARVTPVDIGVGLAHGLAGAVGRSRFAAEMRDFGLGRVSVVHDASPTSLPAIRRAIFPVTMADRARTAARTVVMRGSGITVLEGLTNAVEAGTRFGEARAFLRHVAPRVAAGEVSEVGARMRAATLGRALLDFSNDPGSPVLREMKRYLPFFGAALQGLTTHVQAWDRNPARMATVSGGVGLASLLSWALSHRSDEVRKREMDRLPEQRAAALFYPLTDARDGPTLRLPVSQEFGVIAAGMRAGLDGFADHDPHAAELFAASVRRALPPWLGEAAGAHSIVNLFPPIPGAQQAVEVASNERAFDHSPVVPRSLQDMPPAERRREDTPVTADLLAAGARGLGFDQASPLQADNVVRGVTGAYTDVFTGATDPVARRIMGSTAPRPQVPRRLMRSPLNPLSALFANPSPSSTVGERDYYGLRQRVTEALTAQRKANRTGDDALLLRTLKGYGALADHDAQGVVDDADGQLKQYREDADDVRDLYAAGQMSAAHAQDVLDAIRRKEADTYRDASAVLRLMSHAPHPDLATATHRRPHP